MESKVSSRSAALDSSRGFRGKGPDEPVSVSSRGCLERLSELAPLSPALEKLLRIPEGLFISGERGFTTLSSDEQKTVARAFGSLVLGQELPKDLPDYGIHISSRGGSVFCMLLDKSRKILVLDTVKSGYVDSGSWESFSSSIEQALSRAESLSSSGQQFSLLINK